MILKLGLFWKIIFWHQNFTENHYFSSFIYNHFINHKFIPASETCGFNYNLWNHSHDIMAGVPTFQTLKKVWPKSFLPYFSIYFSLTLAVVIKYPSDHIEFVPNIFLLKIKIFVLLSLLLCPLSLLAELTLTYECDLHHDFFSKIYLWIMITYFRQLFFIYIKIPLLKIFFRYFMTITMWYS